MYLFGAQVELGNYPSSYIPTVAAVTRSADSLYYTMNDGNMNTARGSLECNVLCPNIDNALGPYYFMLSDNTANNRIWCAVAAAGDDNPVFRIATGGVAQAAVIGTTDIWNAGWNKLRGVWGPNDARLLVNSVQEGTQDTSVTVPTGITKLNVGSYLSAGFELNGLIGNIKIFSSGKVRHK
jgi:hypothetical protein